ncbi:hypothetical protein E2562_001608 [Oryza meyeriana var. granulata]|uniref:Uncharacterized protein n=1 Tax=Oryza meyeriana var. granulata TaxID=110450 RepID=A0A6G1CCN3_9ORYZ|nr:hypothetical protein E2562_001608 [Oryza meyeriana var. granulata]
MWDVIDPKSDTATVDEQKEQLAFAIISQAVSDETMMQVASKDSALDVWKALCSMHMGAERDNEAKFQTLHWEFENFCMNNTESVDDFATKAMLLFIHIATTTEYFGDINKISMEEVIGSLKAYEECVKIRNIRTEQEVLLVRGHGSL